MMHMGKRLLSAVLVVVMLLSGIFAQSDIVHAETADRQDKKMNRILPENPVYNKTTDTAKWYYVYFGSYPQTKIRDEDVTPEIINASYDTGNNTVVDGTKIFRWTTVGAKNKYDYYKYEPIRWRVLQNNGSTLFVMADQILGCYTYGGYQNGENQFTPTTWQSSSMNDSLNSTFYHTAFNKAEQDAIVPQTVVTEDNPMFGTSGGWPVRNNIYILSYNEAKNQKYGFNPSDSASATRQMDMSDYALRMNSYYYQYVSDTNRFSCAWCLRTPGYKPYQVLTASSSGRIDITGENIRGNFPVAPVLHIDINSNVWYIEEPDAGTPDVPSSNNAAIDRASLQDSAEVTLGDSDAAVAGTVYLGAGQTADDAVWKELISKISWKSSNTSVANHIRCLPGPGSTGKYSERGIIIYATPKSAGETVITGMLNGKVLTSCRLTVNNPALQTPAPVYSSDTYADEIREFMGSQGFCNTIQYLCADSNFPSSVTAYENDKQFSQKVMMYITDSLYRGFEGWMELFAKSTSIKSAEESLASLLAVCEEDCQKLASVKAGADIVDVCANAFGIFLRNTSVRAVIGEETIKKLDTELDKAVKKSLFDLDLDKSVRLLINEAGIPANSKAAKTVLAFVESAELQKSISDAFGYADIGIKLTEVTVDCLEPLRTFLAVMEADQMYIEMLQYIQENCKYDVVCTAAKHLEKTASGSIQHTLNECNQSLAIGGTEMVLDILLDAVDKCSWVSLIKEAADIGTTMSNLLFHTSDVQKLKDSLRVEVFLGNCLSQWVIGNQTAYHKAAGTRSEKDASRKFYYSSYMLWQNRIHAEKTYQNLLVKSNVQFSRRYTVSQAVSNCLDSFKVSVFTEGRTDVLVGYAIACPVDVQVLDKNGKLLLAMEDGCEYSRKEGSVYCYAVYNQIGRDYEKYIYYPENAGYTVKCIGQSSGTVDCSIFTIQDNGSMDTKEFRDVAVIKDTLIDILADAEKYIVSASDGTVQKENKLEQAVYQPPSLSKPAKPSEDSSGTLGGDKPDISGEEIPDHIDRPSTSEQIPVTPDGQKPGAVTPETVVPSGDCMILVENGTAEKNKAVYGSLVRISADHIPYGYVFHKWEAEGGEVLTEWETETSIVVKAPNVKVIAVFAKYGTVPYQSCYHNKTELRGKVEPSCMGDGYSGAKYCFGCGKIIDEGTKLQKYPHKYSITVSPASIGKNGTCYYKCIRCGKKESKLICRINSVKLQSYSLTYSGRALQPKAILKDSNGRKISSQYYNIAYKNNKVVGTANAIITLKGKYSGTVKKTFKIRPKGTSIKSKFLVGANSFVVRWKKQAVQADGYQIQYSKNPNLAGAKRKIVNGSGRTKTTVKKNQSCKKYYMRIRTYKIVNGRKYFSRWSKVTAVSAVSHSAA